MTNEEIAAYNDAMEQGTWDRMEYDDSDVNEDLMGMDADSHNDNMGYACDDEYYEPDFEDDESAMTSAGMGEDESYGYLDNEPFYYDEQ